MMFKGLGGCDEPEHVEERRPPGRGSRHDAVPAQGRLRALRLCQTEVVQTVSQLARKVR